MISGLVKSRLRDFLIVFSILVGNMIIYEKGHQGKNRHVAGQDEPHGKQFKAALVAFLRL